MDGKASFGAARGQDSGDSLDEARELARAVPRGARRE
jgi:hypothetical protein